MSSLMVVTRATDMQESPPKKIIGNSGSSTGIVLVVGLSPFWQLTEINSKTCYLPLKPFAGTDVVRSRVWGRGLVQSILRIRLTEWLRRLP